MSESVWKNKYGYKKLRQRWRKENTGVTTAVEIQPHFQGSVCLFVLTWIFERWSWRSKHTQPTESTLALLSLHCSPYFDLTFKGQGFFPSKGMQRKTKTLCLSVSKPTSCNKISYFSHVSYHRADFFFLLLFFKKKKNFFCLGGGGRGWSKGCLKIHIGSPVI